MEMDKTGPLSTDLTQALKGDTSNSNLLLPPVTAKEHLLKEGMTSGMLTMATKTVRAGQKLPALSVGRQQNDLLKDQFKGENQ